MAGSSFFVSLQTGMKKEIVLTHKEAVKRALEQLDGRARLKDIYPLVIPYIKYKPGSNIRATLRRLLQTNPKLFRHTPDKRGFWELVSYEEKLAERDRKLESISQITTDVIIHAFNECDNLAEREYAKITMQMLFGEIDAWKEAYKMMKKAGYFSNPQPQIIIVNPQFGSMYEIKGNNVVKIAKNR